MKWFRPTLPIIVLGALAVAGCSSSGEESLTIYSGRSETLVGPLLDQFAEDTGISVSVRYGDTAELAATILEDAMVANTEQRRALTQMRLKFSVTGHGKAQKK